MSKEAKVYPAVNTADLTASTHIKINKLLTCPPLEERAVVEVDRLKEDMVAQLTWQKRNLMESIGLEE